MGRISSLQLMIEAECDRIDYTVRIDYTLLMTNPFDDDRPMDDRPMDANPSLSHYETLLASRIDAELFAPQFHALGRVMDILATSLHTHTPPPSTPPYRQLQAQQLLVEEAIDHLAVRHCADLNGSVTAVGKMSRQLDEAKVRIGTLRCQVEEIQNCHRNGAKRSDDVS